MSDNTHQNKITRKSFGTHFLVFLLTFIITWYLTTHGMLKFLDKLKNYLPSPPSQY